MEYYIVKPKPFLLSFVQNTNMIHQSFKIIEAHGTKLSAYSVDIFDFSYYQINEKRAETSKTR